PHSMWGAEHRSLHDFHTRRQFEIEECVVEAHIGLKRRKFKIRDVAADFMERERTNEIGFRKHFKHDSLYRSPRFTFTRLRQEREQPNSSHPTSLPRRGLNVERLLQFGRTQ